MKVGGFTLARVGRLAREVHGDADEAAEQSKSRRPSQSQMSDVSDLVLVSLIGFGTTSSVLLGAAIGLYLPLSKRMLAGLLACAAGALISALAIDLALGSARELWGRASSTSLGLPASVKQRKNADAAARRRCGMCAARRQECANRGRSS